MHSSRSIIPGDSTAVGMATSHAGEILQGALRHGRRTRRVLLSLSAPALWTRAEIIPTPGRPLSVEPSWSRKAYDGACQLLERLRVRAPEVSVRLTSNIPVGKGCGSSTTDILATARALLAHTGRRMREEVVARLIVDVEAASDSSVLSRPALFRHREGTVEEYLPGAFPPLRVLVLDAQPSQVIDTLSLARARYSDTQLGHFADLVAELRAAFRERDPHRLGAVATASARVSQQFLPKPHLDALIGSVAAVGGYGVAVSHSGTVVSALLPVDAPALIESLIEQEAVRLGMRCLVRYALGRRRAVAA